MAGKITESAIPDDGFRKRKSTDINLQNALDIINEGLRRGRIGLSGDTYTVVPVVVLLNCNEVAISSFVDLLTDNQQRAGAEYNGSDVRSVVPSTFRAQPNNPVRSAAETKVTIWGPASANSYLVASVKFILLNAWARVTSSLARKVILFLRAVKRSQQTSSRSL
jgi:hypothetical protein